jgi:pyridoxamine 5'-phosphate oxidase
MSELDLTHMRRTYARTQLDEASIGKNPIEQLRVWLQEAYDAGAPEPHAMCVCTVHDGRPSARMVLLRGLDERGLVFYTSYFSRKAHDIAINRQVAAVFYWPEVERQVRIEGTADQLPEDESDVYFASRPRGHQLGAWASEQSELVESRELLDQRLLDYEERFEGVDVPRPHSWGGYVIRPERIEFWQGRPNRMHDRLEFSRNGGGWTLRRLQP